jgi:hypothetical protein
MFDYDLELNIDQQLSEIPPEYQDAFRRALERELADTEQNRTDTDILTYLRQRRDDFKRGGFIRPDGRPGLVVLSAEAMYEQALPELVQGSLGEEDSTVERRRTFIKIGVFAAIALLFLFFVFRNRAQREEAQALPAEGTPAADISGEGAPVPTPTLPEITGVEDSLQTIGSLGGALTIGRPSALELRYGRTEETIAVAIDPSRPTPKGELRYNETIMLSDNPVAVWLFGTVLNYAMGIPDGMVRNLQPGDRIILNTDTGASLRFIVAETWSGASYEAGRLLSQNRVGLTLFALPAVAEADVAFAFANYDVTSEEDQAQVTYGVGESFTLGAVGELIVHEALFSHTAEGKMRIIMHGAVNNLAAGQAMMLSLTAGSEQTTAVPLAPTGGGAWEASITLPSTVTAQALFAEFRALPGGHLAVVQLGEAPHLIEQLAVEITGTRWDSARERAALDVSIHNSGEGAVYLGPEFVQILSEGGDAYEVNGQVTPRLPGQVNPHLPFLINPGETVGLTISFLPHPSSVQLQIGTDLWQVAAVPWEYPTATAATPQVGNP